MSWGFPSCLLLAKKKWNTSKQFELSIGATLLPQFPSSEVKERATLKKVCTKTKLPLHLRVSIALRRRQKHSSILVWGFGTVATVTVPKKFDKMELDLKTTRWMQGVFKHRIIPMTKNIRFEKFLFLPNCFGSIYFTFMVS